MTDAPTMIPRYVWKDVPVGDAFDDDGCDYDAVCTDRLTGKEVVRYDLGDPANYQKSHGGWDKREWLLNRSLDPDAEIEAASATVPVPDGEAARYAERKLRRAAREKEEAEAQDLLGFIGDDGNGFDFAHWSDGEETILRPALEKRGYTNIGFYMDEEDSFGPLVRGVSATDPDGKVVRFYYG